MPVTLFSGSGPLPSGFTAWWMANAGVESAAGVPATDTQEVLNWLDQSGLGNTLTGPNDGTKPQYLVNILNGLPIIRFVTANAEIRSTAAAISTLVGASAKTIFTVLNTNAISAGVWYASNGGGANAIAFQTDAADDCISSNHDGTQDNVTLAATSVALIHTFMHDGATLYSGVSDTRTASMASAASGATSVLTQVFNVGRVTANFGSFDIGELVIFNRVLSEAERQQVERYLGSKWGITLPY